MSRRIDSTSWRCGLAGVAWPWRDYHLIGEDVELAKAKLSAWVAGVGFHCSVCSIVIVDGSSRKENRTKSQVCLRQNSFVQVKLVIILSVLGTVLW